MLYLLHSGIIDKLTSENESKIKDKLKDEKNEIIIYGEDMKIIGREFKETIFDYEK